MYYSVMMLPSNHLAMGYNDPYFVCIYATTTPYGSIVSLSFHSHQELAKQSCGMSMSWSF